MFAGSQIMRESWRHGIVVLPYDEAVAVKWGEIQGNAHLRGRPHPQDDSWIAACCLVHDLPLATFNTNDFSDYAVHDGLHVLGN